MKTFRLVGMAIVAVMLSMTLTSCSDDDDDEPAPSQDKFNIAYTRWEIIDTDDDHHFDIGGYVDFWGDNGRFVQGSSEYDFYYDEIGSNILQIEFEDDSMYGTFGYTSENEQVAVYDYSWENDPYEYSMTLRWVENL